MEAEITKEIMHSTFPTGLFLLQPAVLELTVVVPLQLSTD